MAASRGPPAGLSLSMGQSKRQRTLETGWYAGGVVAHPRPLSGGFGAVDWVPPAVVQRLNGTSIGSVSETKQPQRRDRCYNRDWEYQ